MAILKATTRAVSKVLLFCVPCEFIRSIPLRKSHATAKTENPQVGLCKVLDFLEFFEFNRPKARRDSFPRVPLVLSPPKGAGGSSERVDQCIPLPQGDWLKKRPHCSEFRQAPSKADWQSSVDIFGRPVSEPFYHLHLLLRSFNDGDPSEREEKAKARAEREAQAPPAAEEASSCWAKDGRLAPAGGGG